jgi:hypothetical protein
LRTALVALATLLLCAACRFERRPEPTSQSPADVDSLALPTGASAPVADSLRALAAALNEALARGDVSRIAQLTVASTTLIDQEAGIRWSRANAAGPLPPALASGGDTPLEWALTSSEHALLGDGAALVVNEYAALVTGEGVPWKAVETFLFEKTEAGWRVRHLHRSRGQSTPEPPL